MQKQIYMVQASSIYGNSVYFPYTVGSLIAYAFSDPTIRDQYSFCGFFYKKEEIEKNIARLDNPFLIGFSCYLWNYEYNKVLAEEIKKRWPTCIIVFGGHQIYRGSDVLQNDTVDIVLFGEGEESFKRVLLSCVGQDDMAQIPNIAYRQNGQQFFTPEEKVCIPQRVSPYLNGWFDDLLREEKDVSFSAIIETNRGCPNKCAFCDFGNIKSHVRLYDEAMVKAEIEWVAEHQIEFLYIVDANFGLFPRDAELVDFLVEKKRETGFPKKFQASYSKSNPEVVFELNKKINDAGMSKGATLSFQSLNPTVLENIFRENMPLEHFKRLMQLYNSNGIAAYSEIILGLPGETYESFKEGLELLLRNGQHMSINIFNCELLNNSIMSDPAYIEKYGIRSARIEQNQYHIIPSSLPIREYSRIIVGTNSMPEKKWIDSNILGVFIRAFHNLGLLQCYAIYLYYEKGLAYTDFYEQLIIFAQTHPKTVCGRIYIWLQKKYREILQGGGSVTWQDPVFGEINWPMEESVFLMVIKKYTEYLQEIKSFLEGFFEDGALFQDIASYQNAVVKTPGAKKTRLQLQYDWKSYFLAVYQNCPPQLLHKRCSVLIDPGEVSEDLSEYATKTIWFGRRGGKNIVTDITYTEE